MQYSDKVWTRKRRYDGTRKTGYVIWGRGKAKKKSFSTSVCAHLILRTRQCMCFLWRHPATHAPVYACMEQNQQKLDCDFISGRWLFASFRTACATPFLPEHRSGADVSWNHYNHGLHIDEIPHGTEDSYKVSYCSIQVPEIPRWFLQMLANGPSSIATRCLSYAGGKVPATTANVINGQFLQSKVNKKL